MSHHQCHIINVTSSAHSPRLVIKASLYLWLVCVHGPGGVSGWQPWDANVLVLALRPVALKRAKHMCPYICHIINVTSSMSHHQCHIINVTSKGETHVSVYL
jgi:hypothetical protein